MGVCIGITWAITFGVGGGGGGWEKLGRGVNEN